jgi:hypothetical protein
VAGTAIAGALLTGGGVGLTVGCDGVEVAQLGWGDVAAGIVLEIITLSAETSVLGGVRLESARFSAKPAKPTPSSTTPATRRLTPSITSRRPEG